MPDTFLHPHLTDTRQLPQGLVVSLAGSWRPQVEHTLALAERVRAALMRASGSVVPWQLSGKDDEGRPRKDHAHAYLLPFGQDASLDRVLIWASTGFEPGTWPALHSLIRGELTIIAGRRPPLRMRSVVLGRHADLCRSPEPGLQSLLGPATTWVSVTPFMPPRHAKLRRGTWIDAADQQLARLCTNEVGQAPVEIEPFGDPTYWSGFVRRRDKDLERFADRRAVGWRMRFAEPVNGPIALGYGSHFGLGCFQGEHP